MDRRSFLKSTVIAGAGFSFFPAGFWYNALAKTGKKVIVLGIDGMDPHLAHQYMAQGLLPNFRKLMKTGSMRTVGSSFPPQSPVAWSNFTVGASPRVHGIYDFIHRDPGTMTPYLSTSQVIPPQSTLDLGRWRIPLSKGETLNLRKGKPFWDYLAERDIPTTIFKMPANFPCESKKVDMISGMGTPDLRGGYGNYTVFTTNPDAFGKNISGGRILPVSFEDQKVITSLPGPENTLEKGNPTASVPVVIWRDRVNPVIRIKIQDHEFLLSQGEWSDWMELNFPMLGSLYDVKGICKLYVKEVHPHLKLYISPINIDPSDPALPVVTSERYAKDLVRNVGFFYTQGFPEDTKALSEGIFTEAEYLDLAYQIVRERERLLGYELKRFNRLDTGLLFFYFSSLDQDTHMYWRTMDPRHPLYSTTLHKEYGDTIKRLYCEMDKILGKLMAQYDIHDPSLSLMVMSDHGFAPFRRQVNLNSWLFETGYLALNNMRQVENSGYFENVNWSRTGAYNLGINALYLNLRGREKDGIVDNEQRNELIKELKRDLLRLKDPESGENVVSRVRIISAAEQRKQPQAPDLIIGWNRGYRTSWNSILGGFTEEIFADNLDKWSGDHCMDPALVPAVLFSNKKANRQDLNLCDLTATLLAEFSIRPGNQNMEGRPIYNL